MAHDERTHTGSGTGDTHGNALVHAKDVDHFKIPDGQPDPRGWSVKSADGTTLGKVEDLLFDTGEQRIRYIEVRTDGDLKKHGGRDYFLLPIGTARLDDEHDDVVVSMSAQEFTGVPVYERGKVSREYESSLRDYVRTRPGSAGTAGAMGAGAADRATSTGLGDRIADKADDLKDRVDANPASRPGPDATDRELSFYGSPEYDDQRFFTRGRSGTAGMMGTGAADRATSTGLGDRIADKADDLKDRVDGNPASRPGPDATDRRF